MSAIDIVYDGQCGFCRRVLRAAMRIDLTRAMRPFDAHDRTLAARFPMLAGADVNDAMFAVTATGRVYRGYFAFKELVHHLPIAWPILPLFYVPGSSIVGPRLYAWVARNRRQFGCETDVCDVPNDSRPPDRHP